MTSSADRDSSATSAALEDALDALLWFGAAMLRAGGTASRTHALMGVMARRMGVDAVSIALTLDTVTASVRRGGERATAVREIGSLGINASRLGELQRLVRTAGPDTSPRELTSELARIETTPPLYSGIQLVVGIALASGAFAFINGGTVPEMIAAGLGGGAGQCLRAWLSRRRFNPFGVAALSAAAASGVYVVAAVIAGRAGFASALHPAGFISSVLFLVPGFPLIAGLFDLLQHQITAAVSRLALGLMMLLAITLGLSLVIAVAGTDLTPHPPPDLAYPLKLALRAVASFVACCAFAALFGCVPRLVLAAGLLAVVANGLRLALLDMGVLPAPAAFLAALAIGFVALLANRRFDVPHIAMTVPPIVIMVPGVYAFEMLVFFYRGRLLEALAATATCGFVIGALALGLATARLCDRSVDR